MSGNFNDEREAGTDNILLSTNTKYELTCLYLNARSVLNKLDIFHATVDATKPDIIGITETWAHDDVIDAELNIDGYIMFRCDRVLKKVSRGGGVLLFVKEELAPVEFYPRTEYPEHVWCKLIDSHLSELYIGVCYRSTSDVYEGDVNQLLRNLIVEMSSNRMLIMGDLNYPEIDWDTHQPAPQAAIEVQQFMDCVDGNFLLQHIRQPTRKDNILDVALTNEPGLVSDVEVVDCLSTSDHNMITWSIQ